MPACPRCGFELERSLLKLRSCRRCGWKEETGTVASELASQATVNAEDFLADDDSTDDLNLKTGEAAPNATQATTELGADGQSPLLGGATLPDVSSVTSGGRLDATLAGRGDEESLIPGFSNQTVEVTGDSLSIGHRSDSEVLSIDNVLKSGESGMGLRLSGTQGSDDFLMKSEELPAPAPGGSPSENATFVADNLTPAEAQVLQTVWGTAGGAKGARENMTLRGAGESVDENRLTFSSLVISPRKLAESKPSAAQPVAIRSDYDLVKVLGEGGMGVVYDAVQRSVDREVALKMMKGAAARDSKQQHKFLSEAVVTGELDHPNIVPIYDVGASDKGLLFYAMKKVQGTPWNKILAEKSQVANLEILMKVADAIAFAHSRGVVHRDLKPENVMLGDFGEVLVMDWGLALPVSTFRRYASVGHNHSMGGTPAYMAPEMATGPIERISFYSDVYLLGAMLFEILTKKAPHTGKNVNACLIAAAKNDIRKTEVTGELMDIALKAMSTNPKDRYATVAEFQTAIREYLSHSESILLANNAAEDLGKAEVSQDYRDFSRAVFGYEESLDLWQGNSRAKKGLAEAKLRYALCAQGKKDYKLGLSLLDSQEESHRSTIQQLNSAFEANEAQARQAEASQRLAGKLKNLAIGLSTLMALGGAGGAAALYNSNQATKVALAESVENKNQALANLEIAKKNAEEAKLNADKAAENERTANTNAEKAAANEQEAIANAEKADRNAKLAADREKEAIKASNLAVEEAKKAEMARKAAIKSQQLATAAQRQQEFEAYVSQINLIDSKVADNDWDSVTDGLTNKSPADRRHWEWQRLNYLSDRSTAVRFNSRLNAIAVNPASAASDPSQSEVVVSGSDGVAWIVRGVTERRAGTPRERGEYPELKHLGKQVNNASLTDVAWSPDGKLIATILAKPEGDQPNVCLWNPADPAQPVRRILASEAVNRSPITAFAFTPDSRQFVTGSLDGTVTLWSLEPGTAPRRLGNLEGKVDVVAVSDDPSRPLVAAAGRDRSVRIWDLPRAGVEVAGGSRFFLGHRRPIHALAFAPRSNLLASAGEDSSIFVYSADSRELPTSWSSANSFTRYNELLAHTDTVRGLSFGPDNRLLSAGQDNLLVLWESRGSSYTPTQKFRGHGQPVQGCAFAAGDATSGGLRFFSAGFDQTVRLWNPATYAADYEESPEAALDGHASAVLGIAFSKDGRQLVTASSDHSARTWDTCNGQGLVEFKEGHDFLATAALFTPDGTSLVSGAFDTTTRIWDMQTGVQKNQLLRTGKNPTLAVSPDGRLLVTGASEESSTGQRSGERFGAKVWDLAALTAGVVDNPQPLRFLTGHEGEVSAVAINPAGTLLAVGDVRGLVNVWKISDWSPVNLTRGQEGHTRRINVATFIDETHVATAGEDGSVILWDLSTGKARKEPRMLHPKPIVGLAALGSGARLLTTCRDGKLRSFDLATEAEPQVLFASEPIGEKTPEIRVAVDAARERLLLVELLSRSAPVESDRLHLLRLDQAGLQDQVLPRFNRRVNSLVLSPAGNQFLALEGRQVTLLSVDGSAAPQRFGRSGLVNSAEFSPDSRWIVTATTDGTLRVWDAKTGKNRTVLRGVSRRDSTGLSPEEKAKLGHTDSVNSANFVDEKHLLTAGSDGQVLLWNVETAEIVQRYAPLKTADGKPVSILKATLVPGEAGLIAACGADGRAHIWGKDGQHKSQTEPHPSPLTALDFSDDASLLALGTQQGRIYLYSMDQAGALSKLRLASAGQSGEAPAENGQEVVNYLTGHPGSINDLEFLPQHWGDTKFPATAGLRLASGSSDSTVKLWSIVDQGVFAERAEAAAGETDVATAFLAREILTLRDLAKPVTTIAVSADGKSLAAGASDGSAVIWRSAATDCREAAPQPLPAAQRDRRQALLAR